MCKPINNNQQCMKAMSKKKERNIFQQYKYCGLSPSLVSLSVSFYCYLFSLFIFHLLMLLKFGLWLFIQLLLRTVCICLMRDDVRVVVSCWPLLFTWGRYHFCIHMISFRWAELIPNKSCSGDGLCRWLGRSDLHGSHVKMLLVGLLRFPVAEQDASYLHPAPTFPLFLPEDTCTLWNVKKIILCEKKTVCPVLGISSSGWGFEGRLVEASIYEAHCSFLGVLHQLLVLALLGVAPPPSSCRFLREDVNLMSWMWRRPFLGHPFRDRCRTYAEGHFHRRSILSSSTSCLADSQSLNLPPVFNERRIHLAISSRRRRLQEELSAIGLALLICLAGSISTRTKTAQQAIYRDPRLGSRASTSTWASFRPKSIAIRRVRSRPRNPPFFHGN